MEFKDYYAILGVTPETPYDEMKRAFRKLARQYHPDVSKLADAEQRFKEINEAWEVLKDPQKRAQYDQLRQGGWQQQAARDGFRQPQTDYYSGDHPEDYAFTEGADMSDFFEQLFGKQARHAPHAAKAKDIHAKITIPLEIAFKGGVQTVELASANKESKTLQIKIPAGVSEGSQIRLKGQGHGESSAHRGDLYIEIHLAPHAFFTPKQKDIYLNLPIAPWEAALGATVAVPTLGGPVNLKIQPGSQSGQKMRLKDRGLPGNPAGDQYVLLEVKVPQANHPEAKALYEKMAKELAFNPRAALGV